MSVTSNFSIFSVTTQHNLSGREVCINELYDKNREYINDDYHHHNSSYLSNCLLIYWHKLQLFKYLISKVIYTSIYHHGCRVWRQSLNL